MTKMLHVRNWTRFQHYKDRTPPWIKLHWELLASEDWVLLDDASKLLAVVCMLIASRNEGQVPNNPDYIKRVAYLSKRPNLKPLIECGFLSEVLADASDSKQMQANDTTETETDKIKKDISSDFDSEFDDWYQAYPRHEGRGQALKAYRTARKKAGQDVLLAGANEAAQRYANSERRFVPLPASWLNGERWLDDPLPEGPNGKPPLKGLAAIDEEYRRMGVRW